MSQNTLILHDIPTTEPYKCWTPNPWKTRLALNFKEIPYKTEWVDLPDIKEKFKALGLAPHAPGTGGVPYTCPAITYPSGKHIMDSDLIAHELETLQPSPSLHLDDPIVEQATILSRGIVSALFPVVASLFRPELLSQRNSDYFFAAREKDFGMSLSELGKTDRVTKAWENLKPAAEKMEGLLAQNDGPFFLGHTPCYGDLVFMAWMTCFKTIDEDVLSRLWKECQGSEKLFKACEKWAERDD